MLCLVFTQNLSKNKGAFSCQDVFSTIYCQKVKEKREVQLLQHGEHGVQILQVNPFAIKFKVFNSDSWVQLITFNLDNSTTPKQQQQSSTPLECTFACHPWQGGNNQKIYPGPSLRNCRGKTFVWGLCCCLLQINWVVQATEQLDPAAQSCLTSPPHCSFS